MNLEPHPFNTGFAWSEVKGPFRRLAPAEARSFNERGYVVLEDVFDAGILRDLVDVIDPVEARVEELLKGQPDERIFVARAGEITFTVHLASLSPFVRAFCSGPIFREFAHDLLGPDVRLYWDQAVYKKPSAAGDLPWHQDNGYTFVEPQQTLTCWIALTDATLENGCLWFAPGLHRAGTLRHWRTERGWCCVEEPADAVAAPLRAGSMAIFSGVTPHRTGPNLTDRVRKAYIVQFAPDGARTVVSDPATGVRIDHPCDDPRRQFPVLVGGEAPSRR
jgi:phytanoyl-CoA hydroxylase